MSYNNKRKNKWVVMSIIGLLSVVITTFIIINAMGNNQGYRTITVVDVSGAVSVVKDGIEYSAYEGMHLEEGYEIVTSGNSYVRMVLDGNKYIKLEEGSKLIFETLGFFGSGKTKLRLERGAITNELVTPLKEEEEYIIHTPNAILAVRGTFFRVDLNPTEEGDLMADVVTYGGKVATKRVFPDGKIMEEDVLVEAGKQACINMDTERTYFVVDGKKLEDTEAENEKEKTESIVIDEISDEDLIDIYFASKNGHEIFVTEDEAKEKLDERNISIEEYISVYEKAKEVIEEQEIIKHENNKVVNHKVYADDSKELLREEEGRVENEVEKPSGNSGIPVTDGTGNATTETTTDSIEETTTKTEEETTTKSEEETTTDSEEETTSKTEEETTSKTEEETTTKPEEETTEPETEHEHQYEAKTDLPTDTKDGRDYEQCKFCNKIINEKSFLGINPVNFPDKVLREYIEDKFNTDGEAGLRQAEIEAATFIQIDFDIDNMVTSLEGIEHFTALEVLAIGDARYIEDIDISNNTSLISLSIPYGAFTSIDVSNNKELKMLNLTGGKLTSIDVGHLSQLETLYVDDTEIDELDVSSLTSLKTLFCGGTNITELDVTECSRLRTLSVENCQLLETLNAYDTNITRLVTDNCPKLDTLDISGCTSLSSIDLSTNENLKYLYLTNTAITTIDLSNNTSIEELYINGNIASLDVDNTKTLRKLYIGEGTSLTTLDLSDKYNLTELIFYGQKGITTLDLEGCTLMTDITPSQLKSLSELNIKGTGITEIYLRSNTSLKKLNIANTEISELDISQCTELTDLDVSGCRRLTGVNISNNPALVNFNASGSGIMGIDASANTELVNLNLQNCMSLKSFTMNESMFNYKLETLNISGCTAMLFFDAVALTKVSTLDLASCRSLQNLKLDMCTRISGALDLSGLSNLTTVVINQASGITAVNMSNLTNVSSVTIL